MEKRFFLLLMPCLLATGPLLSGSPGLADTPIMPRAQDAPSASVGQVRFYIDTAGFRGAEGTTHLEVYFLLSGDQLSFRQESGGTSSAAFTVALCVWNARGDTIQYRPMMRRAQLDSVGQGPSAVLDLFSTTLKPGDYLLTVAVRDTLSGKEGLCQRRLSVPVFDRERLAISDIQIGSDIADAGGEDKFVKNRKRVTPNVIRGIPTRRPTLYAYFEVYNLAPPHPSGEEDFSLFYAILDSSDVEVKTYPVRRISKPGVSCAKADALDLSGLPSGDYVLRVGVEDAPNGRRAQQMRAFRLLSPQVPSRVLSLDEEALRRYDGEIKYLATQKELDLYRSLDPEGKGRFILDFWKRRDPTPGTPENEFAMAHFQRIHYADASLGHGSTKGSDTDRGRVYILYGPPTEVSKQTQPMEGKSFEVWTYERGGHYEFIFIDRRGAGDYELIHSTMPGERHNPMWQSDR